MNIGSLGLGGSRVVLGHPHCLASRKTLYALVAKTTVLIKYKKSRKPCSASLYLYFITISREIHNLVRRKKYSREDLRVQTVRYFFFLRDFRRFSDVCGGCGSDDKVGDCHCGHDPREDVELNPLEQGEDSDGNPRRVRVCLGNVRVECRRLAWGS